MDQYLVESGHSIASTLIGDHIYYLGWWGVLTGLIMAAVAAKLVNVINKVDGINGYAVVLVSCNMMVFVWGGMTSFSARIIFPLIGVFPLWLIYIFYRNKFRVTYDA